MEPPGPTPDPFPADQPRCQQPCDTDCAYFEPVDGLPEWGLCRDPHCPAHKVLVHPGHECPRFAPRR